MRDVYREPALETSNVRRYQLGIPIWRALGGPTESPVRYCRMRKITDIFWTPDANQRAGSPTIYLYSDQGIDMSRSNPEHYDQTTVWLHWAAVVLIVLLWGIGQTADLIPRGPLRAAAWSTHVTLGFIMGFVLLTRVAWRAHFGRVLPPADTGILYVLAKVTHYTLYVLLGIVVVAGVIDASYRGFNVFGVWSVPQFGSGDAATRRSINEWHELSANLLIAVAALHALAALAHQYVWRDHLLDRMRS